MPTAAPFELIAVEVRADLDQLQQQMPQATRVVDQNVQRMTQSVERGERAIVRASANSSTAMTHTGGAARMMGQQFSQVGQQVAAGANALQALAIQLPDIALGLSATGASAGRLAAFFGGPWGIALTTAAAVAVSLTSDLWDNAEASDAAAKSAQRLAEALANLGTLKFSGANADTLMKEIERLGREAGIAQARANQAGAQRGAGGRFYQDEANRLRAERDALIERFRRESDPATNTALRIARENQARIDAPAPSRGRSGKSDAERAADRAAREAEQERERIEREQKALDERYNKSLAQLTIERQLAELRDRGTDAARMEADLLEANFRIEQQFPELAQSTAMGDKLRLQLLQQIAAETIKEAYGRKAARDEMERWFEETEKRQKDQAEQRKRLEEQLARQQEMRIRTLAQLYYDAFQGGTEAIWDNFKEIGLAVIAEVLARFTLSQFGGGGPFSLGDALGAAIGSVLPGFASGGSMVLGGRGGIDRNTLSLNGRPIAKVSAGEVLNVSNPALSRGGSQPVEVVVKVEANDYFDARVAGITRQVATPIAQQTAAQIGAAVGQGVLRAMPRRMAQFSRDGT